MANLSGRRPTGLGKALLTGLGQLATALADAPKVERINAIDHEITELQQERDHLIKSLSEPIPGLEVSENYDPRWTKSSTSVALSGGGRLVECEGRDTMSRYHDAHPACPYIDKVHNAHEFTCND